MPFPASLQLITLTGDFRDGQGNPRVGTVSIKLPTPIRSTGDDIIIAPFERRVDLVEGAFSIELPATTDPDWLPNTAEYLVQATLTGDYQRLWWSLPLPHDTVAATLDLADTGAPNLGTPTQGNTSQPPNDGGYKSTWASGTVYRAGDTVQHGSSVYGALRASTGVTPGTDATIWKVYPSSGGGGGAVDSVFGRTGDVTAQTGDYAVANITGLQAALDGKQALDADLTAIAALTPSNDDLLQRKAGAWANRTPAQLKTDLVLVKGDVGLGSVDNTSDAGKPVSTAQAAADTVVASAAASALAAHEADTTNIHGIADTAQLATQADIAGRQPLDTDLTTIAALTATTDNVIQSVAGAWASRTPAQLKATLALVKGDVGLGNVDNTSDANKPVSTATQTALDLKAPLASPALTGTATAVNLTQSGRHVLTPDALSDAATIATDASAGNHFRVTLGGNRTLGNPTNPVDGQKIVWELIQDGTGSRTLALDTKFALGADISAVTLTTTASKRDFLGAVYNSTADKWYLIAFVKGY